MGKINKYVGLVLFTLSILYIIGAFRMPEYPYVPIDSNFLPLILGFLLLFLSILLFFSKDSKSMSLLVKKNDLIQLLGTVILIIIYISFLENIGFIIATASFMFLCSLFMGYKNHIVNAIVSLVFPSSIYFIFKYLLMISLPSGILPI